MRYAANLLFEYGVEGKSRARPLCEKRIVVFNATSSRDAAKRARDHGRRRRFQYRNADGHRVCVKFVGVVDLIELDDLDRQEVYYTMFCTAHPKRHLQPRERWAVFRAGPRSIQSAWWVVPATEAKVGPAKRGSSNLPLERTGHTLRANAERRKAGRSKAKR